MSIDLLLTKELLELNLVDLLYNLQLITDEQYGLVLYIKDAYTQIRDFSSNSILYTYIKVQGGKNTNITEEILMSNLKWIKLKRLITFNTTLIENTILINKQSIYYYNELGEDRFYDLIYELCLLIDKLYAIFYLDDYEKRIKLLNKKVKAYGLLKTSRELKINKDTIKYILKGGKNCKLVNVEKLLRFFGM